MKVFKMLVLLPVVANAEICFKATEPVPYEVASVVCIESVEEELRDELKVILKSDKEVPDYFFISDRQLQSEEKFKFVSNTKELKYVEQVCGREVNVNYIMEGRSYFTTISPDDLKLKVRYSETLDNCHSKSIVEEVIYVRE